MSMDAIVSVIKRSTQTHGNLLIMIMIADNINDHTQETWLGIDTIARKARISPRKVIDAIPVLEKAGELIVRRGEGKNGTHIYRLGPLYTAIGGGQYSAGGLPAESAPPLPKSSGTLKSAPPQISPVPTSKESSSKNQIIDSIQEGTGAISRQTSSEEVSAPSADQTLWVQVLTVLRQRLNRMDYDTWVESTEVASQQQVNGLLVLKIVVGNEYAVNHLVQMGIPEQAAEIAAKIAGVPVRVEIGLKGR